MKMKNIVLCEPHIDNQNDKSGSSKPRTEKAPGDLEKGYDARNNGGTASVIDIGRAAEDVLEIENEFASNNSHSSESYIQLENHHGKSSEKKDTVENIKEDKTDCFETNCEVSRINSHEGINSRQNCLPDAVSEAHSITDNNENIKHLDTSQCAQSDLHHKLQTRCVKNAVMSADNGENNSGDSKCSDVSEIKRVDRTDVSSGTSEGEINGGSEGKSNCKILICSVNSVGGESKDESNIEKECTTLNLIENCNGDFQGGEPSVSDLRPTSENEVFIEKEENKENRKNEDSELPNAVSPKKYDSDGKQTLEPSDKISVTIINEETTWDCEARSKLSWDQINSGSHELSENDNNDNDNDHDHNELVIDDNVDDIEHDFEGNMESVSDSTEEIGEREKRKDMEEEISIEEEFTETEYAEEEIASEGKPKSGRELGETLEMDGEVNVNNNKGKKRKWSNNHDNVIFSEKKPKYTPSEQLDGNQDCTLVAAGALERTVIDSKDEDSGNCTSVERDWKKLRASPIINSTSNTVDAAIDRVASARMPLPFVKTLRGTIKTLSRSDLEELIIQKLCEVVTERSTIGELRKRAQTLEQDQERWKDKVQSLTKQLREMDIVMKKYMSEVEKQNRERNFQILAPLRVTRSVGLQVSFPSSGTKSNKTLSTNNNLTNDAPQNQDNIVKQPLQTVLNMPTTQKKNSSVSSSAQPTNKKGTADQKKSFSPKSGLNVTLQARLITPQNISVTPFCTQAQQGPVNHVKISDQQSSKIIDLTDDDERQINQNNKKSVVQPSVNVRGPGQVRVVNHLQPGQVNSHGRVAYLVPATTTTAGGNGGPSQSRQLLIATPTVQQGSRPILPSVPPLLYKGSTLLPQGVQQLPLINQTNQAGAVKPLKHPAPLPQPPANQIQKPYWKLLPPRPALKISKVQTGIVLSWNMTLGPEYEPIASYQLYAYQESNIPPTTSLWKKVGDVKALPLPMACTLTQFMKGHKYHFAVRAVDLHSRIGPFSFPGTIVLVK